MERDFELIRNLLFYLEKQEQRPIIIRKFKEYDNEVFRYHADLLINAGLVSGECEKYLGGGGCLFTCHGITWKGQEYLSSIRNDSIWTKIKKTAKEKSIALTCDLIFKLAVEYTSELL